MRLQQRFAIGEVVGNDHGQTIVFRADGFVGPTDVANVGVAQSAQGQQPAEGFRGGLKQTDERDPIPVMTNTLVAKRAAHLPTATQPAAPGH
jgi:hypothetical protein